MLKKSSLFFLLFYFQIVSAADTLQETESAIFAGGCFWCMEVNFEKLDGVFDVVSGYTGGHVENPSYEQVSTGETGHKQSVLITYDPDKISYQQILDYFWRHIDPTNDQGQFCDKGSQYRPAIFYQNEQQQQLAIKSLQQIIRTKPFPDPVKVELIKASKFYPAEEEHQNFYKKHPYRYKLYRYICARNARLEELWGKH